MHCPVRLGRPPPAIPPPRAACQAPPVRHTGATTLFHRGSVPSTGGSAGRLTPTPVGMARCRLAVAQLDTVHGHAYRRRRLASRPITQHVDLPEPLGAGHGGHAARRDCQVTIVQRGNLCPAAYAVKRLVSRPRERRRLPVVSSVIVTPRPHAERLAACEQSRYSAAQPCQARSHHRRATAWARTTPASRATKSVPASTLFPHR